MRLGRCTEIPEFGRESAWEPIASVRLRLVTPMLGGGSETGKPDEDQPIRPSSVRGALRKWWRASAPLNVGEDIRAREKEIWGMAADGNPTASSVRVEVDCEHPTAMEQVSETPQGGQTSYSAGKVGLPPYAMGLFAKDAKCHWVRQAGLEFTLRLERWSSQVNALAPKLSVEAATALACWIRYGGIGMRTVRGFGALEVIAGEVQGFEWDKANASLLGRSRGGDPFAERSGLCLLRGARVLTHEASNIERAWLDAVSTLANFAKGCTPGSNRPWQSESSHSPWPEADAIRFPQAQFHNRSGAKPPVPRAELGLPRNFHSAKSGGMWDLGQDPRIPGVGQEERLQSPVITKPLRVDGKWKAGIVIMHRGMSKDLDTNCAGWPKSIWNGRGDSGREIEEGALRRIASSEDVLVVLRRYLGEFGWKEEKL